MLCLKSKFDKNKHIFQMSKIYKKKEPKYIKEPKMYQRKLQIFNKSPKYIKKKKKKMFPLKYQISSKICLKIILDIIKPK